VEENLGLSERETAELEKCLVDIIMKHNKVSGRGESGGRRRKKEKEEGRRRKKEEEGGRRKKEKEGGRRRKKEEGKLTHQIANWHPKYTGSAINYQVVDRYRYRRHFGHKEKSTIDTSKYDTCLPGLVFFLKKKIFFVIWGRPGFFPDARVRFFLEDLDTKNLGN
jgi:hypothetical protein